MELLGQARDITFERTVVEALHPGRTAVIKLAGEEIGLIGQLHPTEQKARDLKETYVMELNLAKVLTKELDALYYAPVSKFPSITRDIALVVDSEKAAGELQAIIQLSGGRLLKNVHLFDLYEGEKMEP